MYTSYDTYDNDNEYTIELPSYDEWFFEHLVPGYAKIELEEKEYSNLEQRVASQEKQVTEPTLPMI